MFKWEQKGQIKYKHQPIGKVVKGLNTLKVIRTKLYELITE